MAPGGRKTAAWNAVTLLGTDPLRIYAEQHIDPEEPDPEKKILKLLRGYAELISAPEMQHLGL